MIMIFAFFFPVMMTLTAVDYESQYWPKLVEAINHLLTMAPGQGIPISYEQMYRYELRTNAHD